METVTQEMRQSPPRVRILMGTYNGAVWLEEQLASFVAQTHSDWTLWVSDDGSDDATLEIIEHFDRLHPGRVERVVEGPRQGSAANFLALLCHPDLPSGLVALADQDDVWKPEKLARAVAALEGAGDTPRAYAAGFLVTDADLRVTGRSPRWPRGASFENALVQNVMSGHTLVLNPAALALVRRAGRPKVPYHDWWIYTLLSACGGELHLDPEPVLFYRQHEGNVIGSRLGYQALRHRIALLLDGSHARWAAANMRALSAAPLPLTPQARKILRTWKARSRLSGIKRRRALRRIPFVRQRKFETTLLFFALSLSSGGR